MNKPYWILSACLAFAASTATLRADQFGLLTSVGNTGQAADGQANYSAAPASPPAPQYDWLGRQISLTTGTTGTTGPETQIGKAADCACDCCTPPWAHRCNTFFEVMVLRPRDAEVAYATAIEGPIVAGVPPVQVGRIGVADPDYTPGWRLGATWAFNECSSLVFTYSRFESSTNDSVTTTAPNVIRSSVLHPGTANAGSDFLDARAVSDVDFQLFDIDYRAVWDSGDLWAINYVAGFRYAQLNQAFTGVFDNTGTLEQLNTRSTFEGAGLKLGLDGEKHAYNSGLFIYGRTNVSFIAGDTRARYFQSSDVDPSIVDTNWKAGRIVTILDLELGAGWQSPCGRWRINGGYLFASWYNVLPTDQWIRNVQTNDFVDDNHVNDAITFDGFTMRLTYQW